MNKKFKYIIIGAVSGILNGLFGSGGGIAAVPLLKKAGVDTRKSHATSVVIIFFLSIAATIGYYISGRLDFGAALSYIPSGLLGAAIGAIILKKIDNSLLRRIFGGIMVISAIRIFVR